MSDFDPHQFRDDLSNDIHRRMGRHGHRFQHRRHSGPGGIIIGTAVVLLGVLFLLENFGLVHTDRIWQYWPVILIAWRVLWPLFLIGAGLRMLYRTATRRRRWENGNPPDGAPPEGGSPASSSPGP